jgi:hexosaminidase
VTDLDTPSPILPRPLVARDLEGRPVDPLAIDVTELVGSRGGAVDALASDLVTRWIADLEADGARAVRSTDQESARRGDRTPLRVQLDPGEVVTPGVTGISPRGADPEDERYRLRVTGEEVVITAAAPEGVFRALTRLRQMLGAAPPTGVGPAPVPPTEIVDSPRFAWRGLSLDVARCFFTVDEVMRVIDILSLYNFNVLHLHLTDDQGWRLDIPDRPRLAQHASAGAFGDHRGGYYTLDEYGALLRYAEQRFITVVPEIDLPGHSGAALLAYPELGTAGADAMSHGSQLDPRRPEVTTFVQDVLEAAAAATPGPYLHIGGDEVFGMPPTDYDRFVRDARAMVRSLGKIPVTWQESARTSDTPGDVLQHWLAFDPALEEAILRGHPSDGKLPDGSDVPADLLAGIAAGIRTGRAELASAARRGAYVLLSPAAHLYLDVPYQEPSSNARQHERQRRLGLKAYPPATVSHPFSWEPDDAVAGLDHAVAGIEAALWTETISNAADLQFMLLPRLAAIAERAWSPGLSDTVAAPESAGTAWKEFAGRLARHESIWRTRGWDYFASSLVPWPIRH